jgi:asparagine synthase (glutamine-hydrolysing)
VTRDSASEADRSDRLDGTGTETVRSALADHDPLPGTGGFAGEIDTESDGGTSTLLRDVLGRRPLFVAADDPSEWAFSPTKLDNPTLLPAGHRLDTSAERVDESESVWTLPDPEPRAAEAAVERVRSAVREQIRAVDSDGLAVAFSGGVDSAVVAAGVPDAPLYVVGFEGCHDIAAARDAAEAMDRELHVVEITHDDIREAVPEVVAATGRANPMDVNIAVPLYLVGRRVAADGYDRLALGQGADELFGGYAKVVDPETDDRVAAETVRDARRETVESLPAQLPRDVLTLRSVGVEPVTPFLHDDVIEAALELPGSAIATESERKIALRRAAAGLVPDSVRMADKKAVQYGTYVSRELDRLARQAGYKRRMENHVGRYVEQLVSGDVSPPEEK